MRNRVISPGGVLDGVVQVPADKSISHRYAILASLAEGRSEICKYSSGEDCKATLACLRKLGVRINSQDDRIQIEGVGLRGWKQPRNGAPLNVENSGTTIRLLAGALAGQELSITLTGDDSLRRRPMKRLIDPLSLMGAQIHGSPGGKPPLRIHAAKLHSIDYEVPIPSAQVKSAILLAGLYTEGTTIVREPIGTRDHTEIALRQFGAIVEASKTSISIRPTAKLMPQHLSVPGDLSSAVFLIGAALIVPESSLIIHNVGLNPTRTRVLDFLLAIGAAINITSVRMQHGELVGDLSIRHGQLTGGNIGGKIAAEMIDELPMLAALGPFTANGIEIHGAGELRVKETDRIAALVDGLRRLGARVTEFADGLRVEGNSTQSMRGAPIKTRGDHRIAMAFAVAALGCTGDTTIDDAECAAISFPEFFTTIDNLRGIKLDATAAWQACRQTQGQEDQQAGAD